MVGTHIAQANKSVDPTFQNIEPLVAKGRQDALLGIEFPDVGKDLTQQAHGNHLQAHPARGMLRVVVVAVIVGDKILLGAVYLLFHRLLVHVEENRIGEEGFVLVPMAAIDERHLVNDFSAQGNFHFFQSVEDDEAQPTVEDIKVNDVVEIERLDEWMVGITIILEGIGIGPQPVITDVGKVVSRLIFATKGESSCFQFAYLIGNGEWWFGVVHCATSLLKFENLPRCAVLREAWQVLLSTNVANNCTVVQENCTIFLICLFISTDSNITKPLN